MAWPVAAGLLGTEEVITFVNETFAKEWARQLHLVKMPAPIVVLDGTDIDGDLHGVEQLVAFPIKALDE